MLASQCKNWEAKVPPWDLEMIPEEPEETQLEQKPEQEPEQEAEGASAGGGGAPLPPARSTRRPLARLERARGAP